MDKPNKPARPEQRDSFEKGLDHKPDTPEENLDPDFSEGAEELPDSPEKDVERRFSEGIERSPDSE